MASTQLRNYFKILAKNLLSDLIQRNKQTFQKYSPVTETLFDRIDFFVCLFVVHQQRACECNFCSSKDRYSALVLSMKVVSGPNLIFASCATANKLLLYDRYRLTILCRIKFKETAFELFQECNKLRAPRKAHGS
jgi:hypothetical protein